ncbi:MAG: aminodeoxychorismate lyase, partial [Rhodoferax sp.]|nr:aminodeoxychorismate lyase [Rhodoferax sp.]
MLRLLRWLVLLGILCGGAGWWWAHRALPTGGAVLDLTIAPGTSARGVAEGVVQAGVKTPAELLFLWFRLSGDARQIKAGSYEIEVGTTPISLLGKLVRGEQALRAVTFVEGWNFRQVRDALAKAERLKTDSQPQTPEAIMQALGRPGVAPEGRFFPDTYTYAKGTSDLDVLKRAMLAMDKKLDAAWAQRQPGAVLKSPEEALTLASIIEKETGQGADRPLISGVFNNSLRIGMPLQTDPTVIYGLGATFDGDLRRRDLQ